jgi:hypothetical protein
VGAIPSLLRIGLLNFLPLLDLSCNTTSLPFLRSWDYRLEPLCLTLITIDGGSTMPGTYSIRGTVSTKIDKTPDLIYKLLSSWATSSAWHKNSVY